MELQQVILVDEQDEPAGTMEKMEAHRQGLLHRAFSIFIFNSKGDLLLQRRAINKYHSGGLWSNSCCSHPEPGEETVVAARRRLKEEMGFTTHLDKIFEFIYKAEFSNGLTEYEFDHVFAGRYEGSIDYNKEEVMDYCYKSLADIRDELRNHPDSFSKWFCVAFPKIEEWWRSNRKTMIA
ncbi:MAG: isopentenyl-diphosphate Delta-isomerase [Chitinophagales bacterium]